MKRWKGAALGAFTMFLFSAPLTEAAEPAMTVQQTPAAQSAVQRNEEPPHVGLSERLADLRAEQAAPRAKETGKEARAAAAAEKKAAAAEKRTARAEKKREKTARYKTLFTDNGFTYYLDSKNSRWILRPNSDSEYIIEAWIRLVENTTGAPVAEDGKLRPTKYFLEHYYISPEHRTIMFISELEVTGRPENAVKERPYDNANWEQLVPGSIEDDLYDAVVAKMKHAPGRRSGILSGTNGMSLRDMIEEFARISL